MSDYKICICDDIYAKVNMITTNIKVLKTKYSFIADPQAIKFSDILELNILQSIRPDILVLDLYDKETDQWLGKDCLELIKASGMNIPTIIFYGDKRSDELYDDFTTEFPFVIKEIDKKKDKVPGLMKIIEGELLKRLPPQYKLRYENDIILQSQVLAIGENYLNQLCKSIRDRYSLSDTIILERMVSGYSGAVLFKFESNHTDYILKVSKEIDKLHLEFQNAKDYYHKFPFFNYLDSQILETADLKVVGIIIKLFENSLPLFDYIYKREPHEVDKVFSILFLDDYSFKKHYKVNRSDRIFWTSIFEKFLGSHFSIVENTVNELKPLISNRLFEYSDLKNFLLYQSFKCLDKTKLTIQSTKVLCHGDFHSKNVLIQGNRPMLIDTGGIRYDYWCMDICRLIVDLFMKGFDYDTINYYDVYKLDSNLDTAKSIFLQKEIPSDGVNDKFIKAVNWLTLNCSEIYGELFSPLEFKFGLIKEFLQVSTRHETMPPNRRAIALLAAYEGMLLANESQKFL